MDDVCGNLSLNRLIFVVTLGDYDKCEIKLQEAEEQARRLNLSGKSDGGEYTGYFPSM